MVATENRPFHRYPDSGHPKGDVLFGLFAFACLMPFVSPVPYGSDVQPVFGLLALAILAKDALQRRVRIEVTDQFFFLIIIWRIAYVAPGTGLEPRLILAPVMAYLTYRAWRWHGQSFTWVPLVWASTISSAAVLFHRTFPQVFAPVAEHVVRAVKVTEFSSRGPGGLTPEPSFAGGLAVVCVVLAVYLKDRGRMTRLKFWLVIVQSAVTLLITNSGLGYVLVLVTLVVTVLRSGSWSVRVTATLVLLFSWALLMSGVLTGRGPVAIAALLRGSWSDLDQSSAERVQSLMVGLRSLLTYPLGTGTGSYAQTSLQVDLASNISLNLDLIEPPTAPLSAIGLLAVEAGFPLVLLTLAILAASVSPRPFAVQALVLASLFLITNFSFAFAPTWLLLGLARLERARSANALAEGGIGPPKGSGL